MKADLRSRATRLWLWLRHQVLGGRYRRLVLERVDDVNLVILPEVFNPVLMRTGAMLARNVPPPAPAHEPGAVTEARALDVGTGSGIGAIFAALRGYRVVGVDINPDAVLCARINAMLNNLDHRIEIRSGDLFTPVAGDTFDLVLFNPPFYRGVPFDKLDQAWRSTDAIERFATGLRSVLRTTGEALVVLSTDGDGQSMLTALEGADFTTRVVASHDFGNEVISVYSARPVDS